MPCASPRAQESALVEFRSKLPAGTEADDHTCLRFLRSRKFDVEKAADLYSKDIVRFCPPGVAWHFFCSSTSA